MSGPDIPRGRYMGEHVGQPVKDEAEHFIRCPACGGWIDCRDLLLSRAVLESTTNGTRTLPAFAPLGA